MDVTRSDKKRHRYCIVSSPGVSSLLLLLSFIYLFIWFCSLFYSRLYQRNRITKLEINLFGKEQQHSEWGRCGRSTQSVIPVISEWFRCVFSALPSPELSMIGPTDPFAAVDRRLRWLRSCCSWIIAVTRFFIVFLGRLSSMNNIETLYSNHFHG